MQIVQLYRCDHGYTRLWVHVGWGQYEVRPRHFSQQQHRDKLASRMLSNHKTTKPLKEVQVPPSLACKGRS